MTKLCIALLLLASVVWARAPKHKNDTLPPLDQFLKKIDTPQPASPVSTGSLWPLAGGSFTNLATDNKGHRLNDIVIINIVEQTLAQASGTVGAQRTFAANSGITFNNSGIDPLMQAHSNSNLKGAGTANSQSQLRTSLASRVVAVLPNGNLVLEAEHNVSFNQQSQTLLLRGVARPDDIGYNNSVPSTLLSDLQIEMKGRGVVSDATRQPNLFMRLLLKIVGF